MNKNKIPRPLMTAAGLSLRVGCASHHGSEMETVKALGVNL